MRTIEKADPLGPQACPSVVDALRGPTSFFREHDHAAIVREMTHPHDDEDVVRSADHLLDARQPSLVPCVEQVPVEARELTLGGGLEHTIEQLRRQPRPAAVEVARIQANELGALVECLQDRSAEPVVVVEFGEKAHVCDRQFSAATAAHVADDDARSCFDDTATLGTSHPHRTILAPERSPWTCTSERACPESPARGGAPCCSQRFPS